MKKKKIKPFSVTSSKFLGEERGQYTYQLTFNQSLEHTGRFKGIADGLNAYRDAENGKKSNPSKVFFDMLKKDKELKWAYHCNIAMAFKDNYRWHKEKSGKRTMSKEDIHEISNKAARYFLELLLK